MRHLVRCVLYFALLAGCGSLCPAQGPPAPAGAPSTPPGRRASGAAATFVSLQGRFVISLPAQVSAYSAVGTNVPEGRVEGDSFEWKTADGLFGVTYLDLPAGLSHKGVFDRTRDNRLTLSPATRLLAEKEITLAGGAGREMRFETPGGLAVVRSYLVGARMYDVSVTAAKGREEAAVRVLDSFRLLPLVEVEAARMREEAAAEPSPLPQTPAAPRAGSDARDEGLKGRVKSVFSEDQDLSGTWSVSRRKPQSASYYDERGNLTKHVLYDYKGNLLEVTAYGYLDGERVSSSRFVKHEYSPPAVMVADAPGAPKPKPDPRYDTKIKFKYDDAGRLLEAARYASNGEPTLRYVYKYEGDKKEELVYTPDGSLNQRYVYTLDDKGNETEEITYETAGDSVTSRNSYAYEFDARGNWVKRTTSKWVTKGGKPFSEPAYLTYRTITYY